MYEVNVWIIVQDLFMTALRCRRTHRLSTTMSMRVSLQTLEVQLNKTEEALWNKQILRCLKGASITETLRFLQDAQHIQMRLGDRFVTAVTKSIAAGLNRGDLHPDTADEAYQALSKIKVCHSPPDTYCTLVNAMPTCKRAAMIAEKGSSEGTTSVRL